MTTPLFEFDPSRLPPGEIRVLRNIRDLPVLITPSPTTFFVFDIDETIYQNKHSPCQMMKEKGLAAYQMALANSPTYRHLSFQQKSKLTRTLQVALQTKIPVESDTIEFVHQLQSKGVPVFALTARYSHMATVTKKELSSLNLNLALTSPFPKDEILKDDETDAIYDCGIIFTNAHEKGPVLNRFLHTLFGNRMSPVNGPSSSSTASSTSRSLFSSSQAMPIPSSRSGQKDSRGGGFSMSSRASQRSMPNSLSNIPKTPILSSTPPSNSIPNSLMFLPPPMLAKSKTGGDDNGNGNSAVKDKGRRGSLREGDMFDSDDEDTAIANDSDDSDGKPVMPDRIVFVDDRFQNCVSVLSGLSIAERLRIVINTFHYQSPSSAMHAMEAELTPHGAMELAEFQIHHFITTGNILDDQQTRMAKQAKQFGDLSLKSDNAMEDDPFMADSNVTPSHSTSTPMAMQEDVPRTPDSPPNLHQQDVGSTPLVIGNNRSGAVTPVSLSTPIHHPQPSPHTPASVTQLQTPVSVGSTPIHAAMRDAKGSNGMPLFDLLAGSSSVAASQAAASLFGGPLSSPQPIPVGRFQKPQSRDPRLSSSGSKPSSSRSSVSSNSTSPSPSPTASSSPQQGNGGDGQFNKKSPPNSLKSNSFGKAILAQV